MKKITLAVAILIPILASAQDISGLNGQSYVKKGSFSLFDPSKLSIRQSYSLGYYSGGGKNGSIGYYINSLEYRFSNPLRIRLDLGYLHSPTAMFSSGPSERKNGLFVPGFSLDWRPSDSFNFRLDYRQVPRSGWGYDGAGYGLNPFIREDYR